MMPLEKFREHSIKKLELLLAYMLLLCCPTLLHASLLEIHTLKHEAIVKCKCLLDGPYRIWILLAGAWCYHFTDTLFRGEVYSIPMKSDRALIRGVEKNSCTRTFFNGQSQPIHLHPNCWK